MTSDVLAPVTRNSSLVTRNSSLLKAMNFYTSIRPWYDQIFPYSEIQRDFVLHFGADRGLSIVDAGCGTGNLIVSLSEVYRKTAGLDPDEAMLDAARSKAKARGAGTWLISAGMLDLDREFDAGSVDRLICFGNTLPHLKDITETEDFSNQAHRVLKRGGLLLLQIINYDRIINRKLGGLPAIENDEIRFERVYEYADSPELINFITRLTLKHSGETIENEVPLLAIRPSKVRQVLTNAGFSAFEEFGSFKRESFTAESQPYILVAKRT